MHVRGHVQTDPGMEVPMVVKLNKLVHKCPSAAEKFEACGKNGTVFQCLKSHLGIGGVIGYFRTGMRTGDV
jgi:hypothetical protein